MPDTTAIPRPQRWDTPFADTALSDREVDRILDIKILKEIDHARFPPTLSVRDIIRNDARIETFNKGDLIVRENDYSNSVFFILSGEIRIIYENLPEIGRAPPPRRLSWWAALAQLGTNPRLPEVRRLKTSAVRVRAGGSRVRAYLADPDQLIETYTTFPLGAGDLFGEIAAIDRTPRRATAFANSPCELVEMRWQGLRELRNRDPGVRAEVDRRHRERTPLSHLTDAPLFAPLDMDALARIADGSAFESHGASDLFRSIGAVDPRHDTGRALATEPLIAEEGSYVNDLIVIRSGFARVTEQVDRGHRTIGYVRENDLFGLAEVVTQWRDNRPVALRYSLRAIGYVGILRVPATLVERIVLPAAEAAGILPTPERRGMTEPSWCDAETPRRLEQSLLDFLIDRRIINGTASMVIDLGRCTGCDDCVRACAATHGNNPRFVRQGPAHGDLMVANACMHCIDSVCLIGCPTGAIHRDPATGRVLVHEDTCIGCATCANSCPYGNIRMTEIRNRAGALIVDRDTGLPIRKATKCDLCAGQPAAPACQRACPHDALVRLDFRDHQAVTRWVHR